MTHKLVMTVPVRDGKVELDLPDFADGEVHVTVERSFDPETDWTEEELAQLAELRKPEPKTGAEIAAMIRSGELDLSAWKALNITDSVAWLEEQRAKRRGS